MLNVLESAFTAAFASTFAFLKIPMTISMTFSKLRWNFWKIRRYFQNCTQKSKICMKFPKCRCIFFENFAEIFKIALNNPKSTLNFQNRRENFEKFGEVFKIALKNPKSVWNFENRGEMFENFAEIFKISLKNPKNMHGIFNIQVNIL